jgi:hypothetical protein
MQKPVSTYYIFSLYEYDVAIVKLEPLDVFSVSAPSFLTIYDHIGVADGFSYAQRLLRPSYRARPLRSWSSENIPQPNHCTDVMLTVSQPQREQEHS